MELFRQITANNIELKEYPFLKELAMEAYLMENEDILKLDDNNFADVNILDAEIALEKGRKTSNKNGRIDILAQYGDYLAIIELKVNELDNKALKQLEDYLNEREQIITKYPDLWTEEITPNWIGVLVGSSITPDLQKKLQEGYTYKHNNVDIPIAGMLIRRFRNNHNEIYVITDTFFNFKYTKRNFSRYEFKGETYNKSRLVNAVLKAYVAENPDINYAELEKVFPKYLQGSLGVFTTKDAAQKIYDRTGHKRFYLKPEELISLADVIISTCNQWGRENIDKFIKHTNNKLDWKYKIVLARFSNIDIKNE